MRGQGRLRWAVVVPIAVVVLVMAVCFVTAWLIDEDSRRGFLGEGGPVEIASVVCSIAATVVLVFFSMLRLDGAFALRSAFFTALLAARELDFHNRFTTEGVFRSSFYFRNNSSGVEKAVVVAILIGIVALGVWYARSYAGRYVRGFLGRVPWVLSVALGFGLMAIGKLADSSTWILESVGLERGVSIEMVNVFEETVELAGALVLCVAVLLYVHAVVTRRESSLGR